MKSGRIEVICGSMFSGKSEELLRRLRRAEIAGLSYILCKPVQDTRTNGGIATHSGSEKDAYSITSALQVMSLLAQDDVDIIAIDEAQFLDKIAVQVFQDLADKGKTIIVAGLDLDYRAQPFGPMPDLMAVAETVTKLHAVCVVCGADACRTQRIGASRELIDIGAADRYEARCRAHFEPPTFPQEGEEWAGM